MTSRALQKDTDADRKVYECLNARPPKSFQMVAGAGSGKTTSLIKALNEILSKHGDTLKLRRQKVACITYTEVAAAEIWADVGNHTLVHVSTIHSFLWSLIRPFQSDIRLWVEKRINDKLEKLRSDAAAFSKRVQQRTREKNRNDTIRYEQLQRRITTVASFRYGVASDFASGILGHEDIITMVPHFIAERPLLRLLTAQQYPFLFVDESQDTTENVVAALKAIDIQCGNQFCLGFFGDPMQQIYLTGTGAIDANNGWKPITKAENFRCSTRVLHVANAIRRDGDGLIQTRGRMIGPDDAPVHVQGSANFFVLPIDDRRDEWITRVRSWAATNTSDAAWLANDVKLLVIVHRMAAKRLGFSDLYSALNDKAPGKFKSGFIEGDAWPVRPFIAFVLPLVHAIKNGNEFEAMQILRAQSPLLGRERIREANVAQQLARLRSFSEKLVGLMDTGASVTIEEVLRYIYESKAFDLDPRILSHLKLTSPIEEGESERAEDEEEAEDDDELNKEVSAMDAFLKCPASQFWGYFNYINKNSPFSTQQGIKGTEFERVLVVLDDDEGTHVQFSYDKYLGIKPLSERDEENLRQGSETVVDRTRRLFYVCCTRALKDLVVVLFTNDVQFARKQVMSQNLFPIEAIHLEDNL